MLQPPNKYDILLLPVDYTREFLDFSKDEINAYYEWFLNIKEERLTHLAKFLFQDPESCLKEDNLRVIEMFLINSISTLPKSNDLFSKEEQKIPFHLKKIAAPKKYIFDNRTISICYDVGIFMGELIISLDERIFWKLETDDDFSDYGQPILVKKKVKADLNPFTVAKNMATKIHEGRYLDGQIISAFNVWKKIFKVNEY